jgi:hypothetical protein
MTIITCAQQLDSIYNQNGSTGVNERSTQDQTSDQITDSLYIQSTPRTQDQTSPIGDPLHQQQSQPTLQQSQQPIQSQPEQEFQPLQTQPKVPTQNPVNPNNPAEQNQLNQPVQPTPAPTPTDPTGGGVTQPR